MQNILSYCMDINIAKEVKVYKMSSYIREFITAHFLCTLKRLLLKSICS